TRPIAASPAATRTRPETRATATIVAPPRSVTVRRASSPSRRAAPTGVRGAASGALGAPRPARWPGARRRVAESRLSGPSHPARRELHGLTALPPLGRVGWRRPGCLPEPPPRGRGASVPAPPPRGRRPPRGG